MYPKALWKAVLMLSRPLNSSLAVKENMMQIPFIPKEYSYIECHDFRLWYSEDELKSQIELIIEAIEYALDYVRSKFNFKNLRKIEICLYHSNHQAISSLNRNITGSMAMAPFSTDQGGLVIVQSTAADPVNGNLQRMRRILAHEICHLFIREKSGSSQCLGDGLKNLKVRPYLDEGLAEYLSWRSIGKRNPILDEDFECIDNLEEVDYFLNDLSSYKRVQAFYTSSCLVEFYINELGLLTFFESMKKLSEIIEPPTIAFTATAKSRRA